MYADGKIGPEELKWYARDARAAYWAARDVWADRASEAADAAYWTARYAADAAYWTARYADYADYAAGAAYYARYAESEAGGTANLLETAAICRKTLTEAVFEKARELEVGMNAEAIRLIDKLI
jgi:hypothetical protein